MAAEDAMIGAAFFRFGNPAALGLLWLLPVCALLYVLADRRRARALAAFGEAGLMAKLAGSVSPRRRRLKAGLVVAALGLVVVALARPQFGTRMEVVKRRGLDLFVALDCSASMLAEDVKPSRLERAKHEVGSLLGRLEGDRVGLVAFAGDAFIQCPLTVDYAAARTFLHAMSPDMLPVPGTALGRAIEVASRGFPGKERKYKVLVLITDGEDHAGNPQAAAEEAAKQGVVIYTIGIGSPEGAPIPVYDEEGRRTAYKHDREGQVVMSRLNDAQLKQIAAAGRGRYFRATGGQLELERIVDEVNRMEKKELSARQFSHYEERFQWPLAMAILLLCVEAGMSERRRRTEEWGGRFE
ncbi:MAG: VWA domain-containing protein [Armatimonadota bacterium]